MSNRARPVFHSTGRPGYSSEVSSHPGRVCARKVAREIQVRFTPVACTVQTREGVVHAHPGDAIVTGLAGEHWRVTRAHFANKYRAVAPTKDGEPGRYVSVPISIMAVSMAEPFEVVLADRLSRLRGQTGDWLVDYGDGSLGIVSQPIFTTSYEITP